jgi:hypothetical protein
LAIFSEKENVHATVISQDVIAPERSPRSGNVASTKGGQATGRTRNKLVNTPSRNLELLAIAYTSDESEYVDARRP